MKPELRILRDTLDQGERVAILAGGRSMSDLINHGDRIVIAPCDPTSAKTGDIVFVRVRRRYFVHLVKDARETEVLIGDAQGYLNGWTPRSRIFGIVVEVAPANASPATGPADTDIPDVAAHCAAPGDGQSSQPPNPIHEHEL